jgi:DNA-binding transcriptional LysR family regulator
MTRYPLIVAEQEETELAPIREVLSKHDLPYNAQLEVGTVDTVKHYVTEGHGIGIVIGICLTDEDKRKFITLPIPDELWPGTTYGVIMRSDKHQTKPLNRLLSLLREEAD